MSFINLSIIIPIYNTDKYIEECLESVLNQKLDKFEIILIDDGSTDNSARIIKKYMNKNKNIYYYYQENKGQGAARNYGIDKARGEYIYFMDSDDYLIENKLSGLISRMKQNELDAIFFDGDVYYESETINQSHYKFNYKRDKSYGFYNNGETLMKELIFNNQFLVSPCLYIFKTKIVVENNIKFREDIIHEDDIFILDIILAINNCEHLNELVFVRRVRENSTMTSNNKLQKIKGVFEVLKYYDEKYNTYNFISNKVKKSLLKKIEGLYIALLGLLDTYKVDDHIKKKINTIGRKHAYFSVKGNIATISYRTYHFIVKKINTK